jgi:hypothetical protein
LSVLAQHIAALILHIASQNRDSKLSVFERDIPQNLNDTFGVAAQPELIREALDIISELRGCRKLISPLTGSYVRISATEAEYYFGNWPSFDTEWGPDEAHEAAYAAERERIQKAYPIIETFFEAREPWITRVVETLSEMDLSSLEPLGTESQSLDPILNLDEATQAELIAPLEQIANELQTSNSIRSELGDEAERLSGEIDAGLTLIKRQRVRLSALVAVLLKPLRYLAEKFSGAAIGELASELVKHLLKLI